MKRCIATILIVIAMIPWLTSLAQMPVYAGEGYHIRAIYDGKEMDGGAEARLTVSLDDFAKRCADRGFSLFLPTVFPEGFSGDADPDIVLRMRDLDGDEVSAHLVGEPDRVVETDDGTLLEYWSVPVEVFEAFASAGLYWFSDSGEQWFGITMYVYSMKESTIPTDSYPDAINGFRARKDEREGIAGACPYHWRQIYMVTQTDVDRYEAG